MTKLQSLVFDLYYKQSNTFESISKKLDMDIEDVIKICKDMLLEIKQDHLEKSKITDIDVMNKLLEIIEANSGNKSSIINSLLLNYNVDKDKIEKCLTILENNNEIKVDRSKRSFKYTINICDDEKLTSNFSMLI